MMKRTIALITAAVFVLIAATLFAADLTVDGNVGIGTATPGTKLDVSGGIRGGNVTTTCDTSLKGVIRFTGTAYEFCDGSIWKLFGGLQYSDARFKIGTFTRDISSASGLQTITGIGFQPKAVIITMNYNQTNRHSYGFTDGTTSGGNFVGDANNYWVPFSGPVIYLNFEGGVYSGSLSSFDSDGFTISWVKNSSPSGTMYMTYIAFR